MGGFQFCFYALIVLLLGLVRVGGVSNSVFYANYDISWGNDHVLSLNQGREIQLSMDQSSGSGFQSKLSYGSGFFQMRIKLPQGDSGGVVTAFYLTSHSGNRGELDFEFLGNREGKPQTLQTNVFTDGQGNREQRLRLWFDPTADFHNYRILWNQHQIVFYVDKVPIRVFKNYTDIGVNYPTQGMQVEVSLWDGSNWATDGGRSKVDWSHAPFTAHFQGFDIDACSSQDYTTDCNADMYWWNREKYWKLGSNQQSAYENVRNRYMNYDYCTDRDRYPVSPPECLQPLS